MIAGLHIDPGVLFPPPIHMILIWLLKICQIDNVED